MHIKHFGLVSGLYFSFDFCRSTFLAHTAAYVQDIGFSLTDGANVTGALVVASIFGRIGMGRVADVLGNRSAYIISHVVMIISLSLGLVAKELWSLYMFALFFGFAWGAQAVLRYALTSEWFGLVSLGLLMGILGIAEAGAAAFGSYYAGYLFDIFGNYHTAFWSGITISFLAIGVNVILRVVPENKDNNQ